MSEDPSSSRPSGDPSASPVERHEPTIEGLFTDLRGLTAEADDPETREEVRDVEELLAEAHERGIIESGVRTLDARDAAEAFVGSVIFASPLLVEDGVFDIADHLFGFTLHGVPVFLIANTAFVVFMTYALLEWTGQNKTEAQTLFGVVPLRVFMTLTVSFLVAAVLMTVWGRVGSWASPIEAIARINVIWTVGSLGAALGDILSDADPAPSVIARTESVRDDPRHGARSRVGGVRSDDDRDAVGSLSDSALLEAIHEEFDDLESVVDDFAQRSEVNRIRGAAIEATLDDVFGDRIQKYTSRDIAEAFVGSIFFSIPFLVEDGVFDVAAFFLAFRLEFFPVYFLANTAFVLLMVHSLVYWAGPQDVRELRPIFGYVPRRLVGTALVSFLTAAALMTMWGRVENWEDPVVALARISVVWTVASFGAALGDILPGESSGDDINDDIAALGDATDDEL
ncbi:hypothetical protein Hbl1158_08425 [Halobaculum sp. CBA1158]|uniref:hypothetical protein n=1 Tax=Halobaculum sp. CBA1158 TaxID=2904243 RepID=UPI001F2EB58C|nr:hypothetical protein [Halobaculum sp. CBA1158]UIO98583.1 hypothetical protein Hbl1158_08425 [Halobaculum sp. CBA1158]